MDMSARLQELGFDTDLQADVDRKHMATAIDRFVGKLGGGDVAVFYYSGHGVQVDGENYLIPVDFDGDNETDVRYDTVAAGRVQEQMEKSGAQLNILILDACRNNAFRAAKRGNTSGLAMMSAGQGTFLAFATGPGHTAGDNPSGRNGLFTGFLLRALHEPALSLDDIFNLVREQVVKTSEGKQVPWSQSAVIGRFLFVPGAAPALTPAKVDIAAMVKQADALADAQNYEGALPLYRQAADAGDGHAMNDIGWLYQAGYGVNQDYTEALRWYHKGADAGYPLSMTNIGELYQSGLGVKQDYAEAMRWFRKAAEAGDATGMFNVGRVYAEGTDRDYPEAMRWFRRAVDAGDVPAMNGIGVLYTSGLGVERDYAEAMRWFRKAADAGNPTSMTNIGSFYLRGFGVRANRKQAIDWYRKAAALGDEDATKNLQSLGAKP
jgi:TPR repeat protein